jgi:threonine/homoserine/homoserine lactone efflux protein
MTFPQAVVSFALVAGLLTLVPGIDTSLVLRAALTRSRAYAAMTSLGIFTGALVWGVAAAIGASALLATSEIAYRILTLAGAIYMVWLGVSLIWKTFTRATNPGSSSASPAPSSLLSAWLLGVGTNLLNPKVGVFYIATIPQFIPTDASPVGMGLLLATVHGLLSLTWFAVIIVATGFVARWLRGPRAVKIIDRTTGAVLIGFGAKLALSPH